MEGDAAYQPDAFLADVRRGVWGELSAPKVMIDPYRRNLQRSYLDIANNKLNAPATAAPQGLPRAFAALFISSGDERGYYRAELRAISAAAGAAMAKATDKATRIHLESVRDQIAKILDPEKNGAPAPAGAGNRQGLEFLEMMADPTSCFPDYIIRP